MWKTKTAIPIYLLAIEIVVYYNGEIAESDPLQINTVYGITLKTPANQDAE